MSSKTKITGTKEEATSALVPKLRFPEFRGAWEKKTLETLGYFTGGGTPSKDNAAYWTGEIPWISSSDLNEGSISQINISRFITKQAVQESATKLVPAKSILLISRVGVGKLAVSTFPLCTSQDFTNFTPTDADPLFLAYLLKSQKETLLSFNQGTSIKGFTKDNIASLFLGFPSPAEQQKIASCLSSLDELMAAQARKVDALKTHKKGLMQQLFPREGETQPRLRFPEFQSAGEWEKKTLDAVAPLQRGFDLPSDEIRPGSVPIVYSNGPKGFHERGMAKGPGLVTGRSGTIGKLHFIESGDYWPHNTSLWVTSFKGHGPKFVYYLYESIGFLRFASGSGVPTLNRNDAHSYETSVPSDRKEQQRIADCLTSLDALITAETRKLEALKTHKRGLMQQLFPSPMP